MKNFSIFIGLALVMIAVSCNRPTKTTEKEVKAAEEVLFNADMSTNNEAIAGAMDNAGASVIVGCRLKNREIKRGFEVAAAEGNVVD